MTEALSRADAEMEQENLAELIKLQRQYRIMENDRKAYEAETKNIIKKQRKYIEDFEKEKLELEMRLKLVRSDQYISKDLQNFLSIQQLLQETDKMKEQIKEEKEKIKTIENHYSQVQNQVDDEWKKLGGKRAGENIQLFLHQKIKRMENRLEQTTKLFNDLMADNQRQRSEIDHLLIVRKYFNDLYNKLLHHLSITKDEMNESIQQASQAFDQREEYHSKINSLKERREKEDIIFQQELKDLQRALEHDQNLRNFMLCKTQERQPILETPKPKRKEELGLGKRKDKGEDIQFYKKAFDRISELTGEKNVADLVERIQKTEEENFAIFNYLNELNREIETLLEKSQILKIEINELKSNEQKREAERQKEIARLELLIEEKAKELDNSEAKLKKSSKIFETLKDGIQSMFDRTNAGSIADMIEDVGVNEKNIMTYLSSIEQRALQLVLIHNFLKAKAEPPPPPPKPQSPAPIQTKLTSTLPKVDYDIPTPPVNLDSDVIATEEEADIRPLTPAELRIIIESEKLKSAKDTAQLKQSTLKQKEKKSPKKG